LFTDAYLRDIVKALRDDYGYEVEVKDPKLLELRIEGEISVSSVDELLTTVSATLGLRIAHSADKHIVMSRLL
jgi:transmembrane sensor